MEDLGNQIDKEMAPIDCHCLVDEALGAQVFGKMRGGSQFHLEIISVVVRSSILGIARFDVRIQIFGAFKKNTNHPKYM